MEFLVARLYNIGETLFYKLAQVVSKVLCHPICSEEEELEAVIEFLKEGKGGAFTEDDIEVTNVDKDYSRFIFIFQIVNSYLVWGGVAIHYADQYSKVQHQKFVNEFLLSVVKYLAMDTIFIVMIISIPGPSSRR